MFLILLTPFYLLWITIFLLNLLIERNQKSLKALAIAAVAPFILLFAFAILGATINFFTSPTTPTKSDIIGTYVIDTSQYPGKNARWQHQTYTVEITKTHLTVHDSRTPTTFTYPIEWRYNYKWNFKNLDQKRHHLVRSEPTITRHPFSHTYTFQSPLYGTIFLEKNKLSTFSLQLKHSVQKRNPTSRHQKTLTM